MHGASYERSKNERMTTGQKNLVIVYLKRLELIPAKVRGGYTSSQWRDIFKVAGVSAPANDPFNWPSVDEFLDAVSMANAHDLIQHLQGRLGIKDHNVY